MFGLLKRMRERLANRHGRVEVSASGFTLFRDGEMRAMRWDEVCRIEAVRQPTIGVEIFYAVLHREGNDWVLVDDMNDDFHDFEEAVFARWPRIGDAWTKVFMGSPDIAEREELWRR